MCLHQHSFVSVGELTHICGDVFISQSVYTFMPLHTILDTSMPLSQSQSVSNVLIFESMFVDVFVLESVCSGDSFRESVCVGIIVLQSYTNTY